MEDDPAALPGPHCAVRPRLTDLGELDGLVRRLRHNARPTGREDFTRGALLPDGRLDLCKQTLGPEGVEAITLALRGNTSVTSLLLGANQAGPAGGRAVATLLGGDNALEAVYLGCNQIGPEATADIAAAVRGSTTVRQLWLKRNGVGDAGARAVAAVLGDTPGLRTLDLVSDDLTAAGIEALAEALATPGCGLAHLFLDGNALGPGAAGALVKLLRAGRSLHTVSLGCNGLGDRGASLLAEALGDNTTLRGLYLPSNDIGQAGAEALADALGDNTALVELSLGYAAATEVLGARRNRFGDAGARALAAALGRNRSLRLLDVSRAEVGPAGVLALLDAADDHPALRVLRVGNRLPDPVRHRVMALACRGAVSDRGIATRGHDLAQVKSVFRTALGGPQRIEAGHTEDPDPDWFAVPLVSPDTAPGVVVPPEALGITDADLDTAARVLEALAAQPDRVREARAAGRVGSLRDAIVRLARQMRRDPSDLVEMVPTTPGALRGGRGALAETGQRRAREDQGIALAAEANAALRAADGGAACVGGALVRSQRCYICKTAYTQLHPFYFALCEPCAAFNWARRHQTADLTGRWVLLTGARIKIGFEIALKLLRAGATVIATTRFPHDAARRFAAVDDAAQWSSRLRLLGLDLCDIPTVERFARDLAATVPRLDAVINNAAQTVWRPPEFYAPLRAREALDRDALPPAERALLADDLPGAHAHTLPAAPGAPTAALETSGGALFPTGSDDGFGQPLDLRPTNSWRLRLGEVSTREALGCYAVNALAPFVLLNALRGRLAADKSLDKWVVNVSAVEGQFDRWHKTPRHPHTNMAKAALNMLTRTAAQDWAQDRIYMTAVDTGWVSNENPWNVASSMAKQGFQTPLDEVDGAARVLDPVFQGARSGQNVWGVFLKDYKAAAW